MALGQDDSLAGPVVLIPNALPSRHGRRQRSAISAVRLWHPSGPAP